MSERRRLTARPENIKDLFTNRDRDDAKNNETKPDVFTAARDHVSLTTIHEQVPSACALAIASAGMLRRNVL